MRYIFRLSLKNASDVLVGMVAWSVFVTLNKNELMIHLVLRPIWDSYVTRSFDAR